MIADTPPPPYYAVIFSSLQSDDPGQLRGYGRMAERMEQLAREQPGYLGFEAARDGLGIAVSYWRDEASLLAWKENVEHLAAQTLGRERWYRDYCTRVCRVERAYRKADSGFDD